MRILVTNDDSISATILPDLVRWCKKLGDVTVVVPKYQQSGKSQGIEIHDPYEVRKVESICDVDTYTVDATPADCVRFAMEYFKMEFDLVISGVNKGYNVGKDVLYSGTAGAAFEANARGIPAMAISTSFAGYETAVGELDRVWAFMQENKLWEVGTLYNVNIPVNAGKIRITRQGGPYFSDVYTPIGNDMYQPSGACIHKDSGDLTLDTDCVVNGDISLSPLTVIRTDMVLFEKLSYLNK